MKFSEPKFLKIIKIFEKLFLLIPGRPQLHSDSDTCSLNFSL